MRNLFLLLFFVAACKSVSTDTSEGFSDLAQSAENPPLMTVGDSVVMADEFIYVYEKNNANLPNAFTQEDVEEYLGLYENFKVKIREAYARGMDTTEAYNSELAGYEDQLKKPYLTSTRITEELIQEAYDRTLEEVRASHILIRLEENSNPSDSLLAYNKITRIRQEAASGLPFDSLASLYSEDPSARTNGGDLGYFSSMQMVYPFENAAYFTPVGSVSPVIRTRFGYHIIKVVDRRPANGKVKVSHIMLRNAADSTSVEAQISQIHDQAVGGVDWRELVASYSEDTRTKDDGGVLSAFGIGQVPIEFQEAAFALESPGDISDPVKTAYGWHIIRLESREPIPELEKMRPAIERRIEQDDRSSQGEGIMLEKLKNEWGFSEEGYMSYKLQKLAEGNSWAKDSSDVLFTIGELDRSVKDFHTYLLNEPGRLESFYNNPEAVYNEFLSNTVFSWEEANLEDKYPEYRMLLREYKEGILYFQLMEEEIWQPSAQDSAGIRAYFDANKDDYPAAPLAEARVYSLPDESMASSLMTAISERNEGEISHLSAKFEEKYQKSLVPVVVSWEEGSESSWNGVPMKEGVYKHENGDNLYIVEVTRVVDRSFADFSDIRGTVISDYQKYLEDEWVKELKAKYTVIKNEVGEKYIYAKLVK